MLYFATWVGRMAALSRATRVCFGEFELDLRARELHHNGHTVLLQPQVFVVLVRLLDTPGEVVVREDLQRAIWPSGTFVDFESGLNAIMRRLRHVVGDDADTPRYIETLPRIGYRFIAPVTSFSEQAPDANAAASLVEAKIGNVAQNPGSGRRYIRLGAALASLLVLTATLSIPERHKEAQRAYAMGVYELERWTRDDLNRSAEYFERSLRYDDTNAAAWAGLARSYTLLAALQFTPSQAGVSKAKAAALKALDRNPSSAAAHTAMGGVLMSEWSWTAAGAELRRALSLDPQNADAHQLFGYWLLSQAQAGDAVTEMKRALDLAPQSPNKRNSLAVALFYARRFDEALAMWRDTAAVEANSVRRHLRLVFVYDLKGLRSESIAEMLAALRSSGNVDAAGEVEQTFASRGYEAARRAFYRKEIDIESGAGQQHQIAADYIALGENDHALAALNRAAQSRETGLNYLSVDPRFDALRSDTRFSAVLGTVGLPQTDHAPDPPIRNSRVLRRIDSVSHIAQP